MQCSPRGVVINPKKSFSKPFLPIDKQIAQLKNRGMLFKDTEKAKHYLENINYYRLSTYWFSCEKNHEKHTFKEDTYFEDIIKMYMFDKHLRLLVLDALERIEISVRTNLTYSLTKKYSSSHPHLKSEKFNTKNYENNVKNLKTAYTKSKEPYINHFKETCTESTPALWVSVELMTFGSLSKWFTAIRLREDRQEISRYYDLDEKILASTLHNLTFVRNICAHHSMLYNKSLSVKLKIPKNMKDSFNKKSNKIYNTFVMVDFLLKTITPSNT